MKEAAYQAMLEGKTHYTNSLGIPELRQAISHDYHEKSNVEVDPGRIIITNGSSPAMLLLFASLLEPGDEVILSNPGYACYPNIVDFVDGKPVDVLVFEEDGFQYRPSEIEKRLGPRTKAIIINSPSNPTGNLLEPEVMEEIASFSRKGLYVVSDEIYHGLVYERKEHSILEFTDHAFVINGFSKLYAMTGWRLGFGVIPENIAPDIAKLQTNSNSCTCSFTQMAGIEAVRGPQDGVKRMVDEFRARRDLIVDGLNRIPGLRCHRPLGSFYVFPNIQGTGKGSKELEILLMEEAGVAALSGTSFGAYGEGYIRLSYATSMENIKRGLDVIEKALDGY